MEVQVVAVVLVAVLVGVAVPALLQLRRTLRSAEIFLEATGAKLNSTLDETAAAAAKIRAVAGRVEDGSAQVSMLFEPFGGAVDLLGRALAALRAWRSTRGKAPQGEVKP